MQKDTLYLASQSSARQRLLTFAQIDYKVLQHHSDEKLADYPLEFHEHVLAIAKHKMQTLKLPAPAAIGSKNLFVLTADTLVKNTLTNQILGKPLDRAEAIQMLTLERQAPVEVVTGCCLEKFQSHQNDWQRVDFNHWTTGATIEFNVDADFIDQYLATFPFILQCSGAGMVEDHGLSYLKTIHGSYTAVIGLPLYELRQALKKMDFNFF